MPPGAPGLVEATQSVPSLTDYLIGWVHASHVPLHVSWGTGYFVLPIPNRVSPPKRTFPEPYSWAVQTFSTRILASLCSGGAILGQGCIPGRSVAWAVLWDLLLVTVSTLLGGPGEVLSRQFCRKEKRRPGLPGFLGGSRRQATQRAANYSCLGKNVVSERRDEWRVNERMDE